MSLLLHLLFILLFLQKRAFRKVGCIRKTNSESKELFLCTVLLTDIITSTYFHKEKFPSATVGLSDHRSVQHMHGTRRVTNEQIPRPNAT
jgi:hypothetical protein